MQKKFRYGIFDLDGTIVNAMPAYAEAYSKILDEEYGISPELSMGYYLESAGTPLCEQFRHMLELHNKPLDLIPRMAKEFFEIGNKKDFMLFDGAKDALKYFHKKGISLFITTGSEDGATKKRLNAAGLSGYITLALGSSLKEKGPWHIEKFAKAAMVPVNEFSEHAFYCGDGPYDMQIARMFGIYAIGIATTVSKNLLMESGADVAIDEISDVAKLNILNATSDV